ncbi:mucin-19 [Biomphalaria glabrata]|nr:mucin-19 [Biomphalaria glabrata]
MSSCDHFTQNAWRHDLCSTCQRAKSDHDSSSNSRSSWRRRSEPNPNNEITGVRISALASKFQASEPVDDKFRTTTLDRKYVKAKVAEKKLNVSLSTDLVLNVGTTTLESCSTNVPVDINKRLTTQAQVKPENPKSQALKVGNQRPNGEKKINSTHSTIKSITTNKSYNSTTNAGHSTKKETPPVVKSSKRTKAADSSQKLKKVSIPDTEPELIGTDGGLDNLFPDQTLAGPIDEAEHLLITLTEEEKQFTLLSLGNTLWNSDTKNLQVDSDNSKRTCREFEDVKDSELLTNRRFKHTDCDAIKHLRDFGTFPKSSGVKSLKVSLNSVQFGGQNSENQILSKEDRSKPAVFSSDNDRTSNTVISVNMSSNVEMDKLQMNEVMHDAMYESLDDVKPAKLATIDSSTVDDEDQSAMDSLHAIALLNDVLKEYVDFNESSTDDIEPKDCKKESLKGKKSSDFEAKMASVAANLDLTKQQRKKQAPRPPVSPPPEPTAISSISPKKGLHQTDPVFKMVTVGKSIVTLPPQQDIPRDKYSSQAPPGLEDFIPDSSDFKSNGEAKNKKGLTSFFRNILRRGKESSESFESQNPDVQFLAKLERKDSSNNTSSGCSLNNLDDLLSNCAPSSKQVVLSQKSPQHKSELTSADGENDNATSNKMSPLASVVCETTSPLSASPPIQRKKGLASPKMMLKKATAKFSPPTSRHQCKESSESLAQSALASNTVSKPYPAPKPAVVKTSVTTLSTDVAPPKPVVAAAIKPCATPPSVDALALKEKEAHIVKRRSKSPKRTAPPVPPVRSSVGSTAGTGTLGRESTRRSLPVPPSPPGDRKVSAGHSSPISPINEMSSLPSSPSSPMGNSFDFATPTEWSGGSSSTIDDELPKFTEKIELPTVAKLDKKGLLGKLGGNRKSRAPQPPSVKRAKSITESSTLPRGDKKNKKIKAADISGPMMVSDRILENRRNTISLGDDAAFHAVVLPNQMTTEKSGFDEFDFPVLSPLGSLENLYESILPKPEGAMFHYYDPPTSPKILCPNIPADGYLEPVPPLSNTTSASTGVSSPQPSSSASVIISNSPSLRITPMTEEIVNKSDNWKDESSPSSSSQWSSGQSSQSNSTENSGSSLPDNMIMKSDSNVSTGLGSGFVEPELTDERRILLASQPIYEEIPNGNNEDDALGLIKPTISSEGMLKKTLFHDDRTVIVPAAGSDVAKSQVGQTWLQQPQVTSTALSNSPSHANSKQVSSMVSSQMSVSSLMTTSLTSSMLPPPPPPPDHLPASTTRSVSRETVSSESDSNCSTLSRPRPAPRRKPKRLDASVTDQYVSMNRPNAQVSLNEDNLKDLFTKLTSITFHSLQDIYAQCERLLSADKLDLSNPKLLKWVDFDIYGQPLHASGRCIVYNAKLKINSSPCQLMILHSRPATERCITSHPSLLRPSAVFADTIPFSFLTPDFIKTSQLLQNSVYDSSQAKCFIAVGAFDVVESLDSHLMLLRETLALDPQAYLNIILIAALQLLSAMSHCLDQGFSVTETDYNDVFLITRSDLRGKVVAFLPHQRSLEVPQGEAMCNFLDRLLMDSMPPNNDEDDIDDEDDDGEKIISAPRKVVAKLREMLEPRRVECLGQVRTAVEYLLWGPSTSELPLTPIGATCKPNYNSGASKEQELYIWLEKQRAMTVGRLARNVSGLSAGLSLEEFYTLKFLLKSSAACLVESLRRLTR